MATRLSKHAQMTKLIDSIEMTVLKTPLHQTKVPIDSNDLLTLIEYARQCEAVILMMDEDPSKAKQSYKS